MRLRSDEQLLAAFRTGSESAFAAIHDRYRQRLFAYARQMLGGSRQDAEDVLQDVFLRAYATLRADGRAVTLRPWLYRVAHNRCVDQIRRPAPAPVEIGEDTPWERPSASLHDPLESAQRREELARLVADIRRLPEQQRSALLMREIDGMTYGELAAALEVSVAAVKSLLVRARTGLAEAGEAREAACGDIRADLADSHDRGVRVSGHARRHLRDCDGCTRFRVALRATSTGMGALLPGGPGPLAALAQSIGLAGAGSGAATAAGASGGMSAAWSAGAVTKVTALVGAAVIAAGGAGQVSEKLGGG
ncbi:MAG TPA: RNA polymerase sigma factor, partial [Solirubrobacteraceae bacterium]|nr:RNA polymerase sigma factor [Solirubrobacteraceae bacterium]